MADFKITKIIERKRNGEKLTENEIRYFIERVVQSAQSPQSVGIVTEPIIDRSQIGAMLMAMYLKGLDSDETTKLTETMTNTGYVFTWPKEYKHLVVDKHSTGGVGDKVSLILAPLLAAVGLKVPMISGRSLSHTGGTLDKLESIPGFRVSLNKEEIYEAVKSVGCCIVSQTPDCAPADKILYACREITATVTSPPIIVASIVSKKLCEGIETLVYDVKYGKGSVFSSKEEALETAKELVINSAGVKRSALLTSMENPLGRSIGNSLEVKEAIDCLKGNGPSDVLEITYALGMELIKSVKEISKEDGLKELMAAIENGKALEKFKSMIINQGVKEETAEELCYRNYDSVLPKAQFETSIFYNGENGYIQEINPLVLASICKEELEQNNKHPGVGLKLLKVVGDTIEKGEPWIIIFHQSKEITPNINSEFMNSIVIGKYPKEKVIIEKRILVSDDNSVIEEKYE